MNTSTKIRILAALGTLSGAVWAGTFASFTDTGAGVATFSNGTVDLQVGNAVEDADYAFTTLSMSNAKPGDVDYGEVEISNDGTIDFTYDMAITTTDDGTPTGLGAALLVEVKHMDAAGSCTDAAYTAAAGSVVVAERALDGTTLTGQALAAANVGDTDSAILCFKVTFPNGAPATDNLLQGAATSARLVFTATTP